MGGLGRGLRNLAVTMMASVALTGAMSQMAPAAAEDKKLVIGASVPLLNDPAWVRIIDYAQFIAKQLDVTLDVVDAQGKEDKQINDIQSLLSKHIDALLFVPVSAANAPAIIRLANRAKVPAVATDRYPGFPADNPNNPYLTFVGPDNVECGRKIGEYLISHGAKNFVGVEGTPGDANNQERTKGMHDAITAHAGEGVRMVQELGGLQTEDNGYQLMRNLLSAHPSGTIDGVFCYNDALCVGAYRAIKQAGRDKEMILGATDLNPQALDLIKAKTNYVYSIGGHWVMVGFATMIAYDYLHGHKPLSDFSRIEDVGVDAAGFDKFKDQYIDHFPSFDIKQYMLTFNPNTKTQTPPLTLQ
jgi:ABC-type sugar transport system substrate-binding protein